MLLKHTSKPLDRPLIVLFLYSRSRHNLFCKLKSKFSAIRLHVPDVMEKKICSCSYIVSEEWESYPLEFVLILFEDSGFLIDVKGINSDYWKALVLSLITTGGIIKFEEVWQAHSSRLFQVRSLRGSSLMLHTRYMHCKSSNSPHRYNTLEGPVYHLPQRSHNPLIMTALWSLEHSGKARAINHY